MDDWLRDRLDRLNTLNADSFESTGRLAAVADWRSSDEPQERVYAERWIDGFLAAASVGYFLHQASRVATPA